MAGSDAEPIDGDAARHNIFGTTEEGGVRRELTRC